jgi:hypothetical protein
LKINVRFQKKNFLEQNKYEDIKKSQFDLEFFLFLKKLNLFLMFKAVVLNQDTTAPLVPWTENL